MTTAQVLLALAIGFAGAWGATYCARGSRWARPVVGAISGHTLGFLGLKIVQCADIFNIHPDFRDVFRLYDPSGCTCTEHCPPDAAGNTSASLGGNETHLVTLANGRHWQLAEICCSTLCKHPLEMPNLASRSR